MYEYTGRLIRVIDGDTLVVEVDLGFYIRQEMKLRLRGIDTPELLGETLERGLLAKAFVEEALSGSPVLAVRTHKIEKWGRFVADVYYGAEIDDARHLFERGKCLSDELLEAGLGVPFM